MASESVATLLLRITAESGEGKADLAEFAAGLEAVGGIEANPEVDVKGVGKGLAEVGALVTALETLGHMDVKIDVSRGGGLEKTVHALAEVGEGAAKGVEAVASATENLAQGATSASGPLKGLFGGLQGLSVNIGSFGGRL